MFFDMSLSFAGEMCSLNLDSISKDKMRLVFVSLSESPISLPMTEL